jgi:polysaccharide export outer membrane protein
MIDYGVDLKGINKAGVETQQCVINVLKKTKLFLVRFLFAESYQSLKTPRKLKIGNQRKQVTNMGRRVFVILLVLLFAAKVLAADYVIGEGDKLEISVWGEKDLTLPVIVRPDGKISIPAVGEVMAANSTVKELQATLTGKIGTIVKSPIVTVMVTGISNNKVYLFGGGVKLGVFTLTQRTSLLQLLCQIEDVRKADLKKAYVLRRGKKIKEDFTKLYLQGDITEDIAIESNDIIYISTNEDKNVYVMGAVNKPRFVEYHDGLTVTEAILEAGGFTKFASPNDTIIYRKTGAREVTISVKMKKLINDGDLTQNARLQPGDYIVVKEGIF